jgi:hypothetical protein
MTTLNPSTLRRIKKLKQSSAVWEGDRRSLPPKIRQPQESSNIISLHGHDGESKPDCILWVDGSQSIVRSMDVVDANIGQEAIVRSLLQAIEHPQSPAQPSLPQKIVVCDRTLQFYLRGVLQDLKISVEYAERLPLIDEIFSHIVDSVTETPPVVPEKFAAALQKQSARIWKNAPWNQIWDHQVISIKLDRWDIDTLYVVIMGRMGLEQGVIFYRSEESLVKFRHRIVAGTSEDEIEETFLHQDCLFNLFETPDSELEEDFPPFPFRGKIKALPPENPPMKPIYGTLHPLEGGRPYLYDEEAIALTVALESLNKFWEQHHKRLKDDFSDLSSTYTIHAPSLEGDAEETVKIVVKTMPELADELSKLVEDDDDDDDMDDDDPLIHEDLFPDNALINMMTIPWDQVAFLRNASIHHQLSDRISTVIAAKKGEGLPGLMIQVSRPNALDLIEEINDCGGISGLCFNPAEDIFGNACQLGLMILGDDEMQLFGEFDRATINGEHHKRWKQRAKNTKGNICVIIAMGITGRSRGNPSPQHILGYYEIKLIDDKELGLGKLRSEPAF